MIAAWNRAHPSGRTLGGEAGLLVSDEPPLGRDRFDEWLTANGAQLGRTYTSELRRNFS